MINGANLKINKASKSELLIMRKLLFNAFIRNLQKEEKEGMYLVSLLTLLEFERATRHITDSELVKN